MGTTLTQSVVETPSFSTAQTCASVSPSTSARPAARSATPAGSSTAWSMAKGETTAQRLTALDRDWHPECFKCIDCEIILDSKKGIKCYPTMEPKKEPLCGDCNQKRRD